MSDHTFYDADFFASHGRPRPLRKQVGDWIDRYCATTGKSHSFAWRKAYLDLEEATGFRVPETKSLDAIEGGGLMKQLLEVVKSLSRRGDDHAGDVSNATMYSVEISDNPFGVAVAMSAEGEYESVEQAKTAALQRIHEQLHGHLAKAADCLRMLAASEIDIISEDGDIVTEEEWTQRRTTYKARH